MHLYLNKVWKFIIINEFRSKAVRAFPQLCLIQYCAVSLGMLCYALLLDRFFMPYVFCLATVP